MSLKKKIVGSLIIILTIPSLAFSEDGASEEKYKFDFQGEGHYSHYNFTDIKKPYDGFDAWAEIKLAYWIGSNEQFSVYARVIPTYSSEEEFWWQKNNQLGVGFQWYPTNTFSPKQKLKPGEKWEDPFRAYRGIRFYALYAWSNYYDKPEGQDSEDSDIQIGADYYYDNLKDITKPSLAAIVWSNAGYRQTNFSLDDYNTFLWTGNIKVGSAIPLLESSILLPYVLTDWTYVPRYEDRWWENYIRLGAGLKWYPTYLSYSDISQDYLENILKRFNIYVEVLHNTAWLGDDPTDDVEKTDYRIGFAFSTFFN